MEIKLGFGSVPRSQYIFVSRDADSCWYMLSADEKQVPITERALTGVITGIECNRKVETKFGEAYKTDLSIMADKPYVIRSGRDSWFSKSLLLSLDVLTVEQLQQPLTISVRPGDKKVVFCEIYDPATFKLIDISKSGYREIDLAGIETRVNNKIIAAQSHPNSAASHTDSVNAELRKMLLAYTDQCIFELGWTKEQGRQYLQYYYNQRSRYSLTDVELLDFMIKMLEIIRSQAPIPTTSASVA